MSLTLVVCDCGRKNYLNPEKHQARQKYCTFCRAIVAQPTKPTRGEWWTIFKLKRWLDRQKEKALRRSPEKDEIGFVPTIALPILVTLAAASRMRRRLST